MHFDNRDSILLTPVSNENHVSDINYSIKYTRWFLSILGIWPLVIADPTTIEKNISKFLRPFSSISMIILTIPPFTYLILRNSDRSEFFILIAPVIFQMTNFANNLLIILRANPIKLCIEDVKTDWRRINDFTDRNIMMRNVRSGNFLTITCALFIYSNILSYHLVVPLLSGNTINELNKTIKPLTFPGTDIFFDPQSNIIYEIVFTSNILSAFVHYTVKTAVCNLAAVLVSHACGQIQIIIRKIENLVDENVEKDRNVIVNKMDVIIRNHVRVLKFANRVEIVLREICLMEVTSSILIICLVEYCCITEWSNSDRVAMFTYFGLLVTFIFNLLLFCQLGQVLKEQCQKIGEAAYMIEWYRLPGKTNLALVMIISMGNYPFKLSAGRMMELSIASFASSLKTSFAYLNMLRKVA